MTKHRIDTPRTSQGARLTQYLRIARSGSLHHSTRSLVARLRARADQRMRAYARIMRGHQV